MKRVITNWYQTGAYLVIVLVAVFSVAGIQNEAGLRRSDVCQVTQIVQEIVLEATAPPAQEEVQTEDPQVRQLLDYLQRRNQQIRSVTDRLLVEEHC